MGNAKLITFDITELNGQDDKVYVRWKQTGTHIGEVDGYKPTGKELVEFASCVYRVQNHKIVEYWVQGDRLGFELQLKNNMEKH